MANTLYDNARELFLKGQLAWHTADIRACLVDKTVYSAPNFATDTKYSDLGLSIIANSPSFASKTTAGGAAGAANITFTEVAEGDPAGALVIYAYDNGTPGDSILIAYLDDAVGLPITPNGGDIVVTWDSGPNKIFKL